MLLHKKIFLILVLTISALPFLLNQIGIDFASASIKLNVNNNSLADVSADDQFRALSGALHHVLLEWSAVTLALIAGFVSFVHYSRYRDISVPIIGLALLCAGFTDAFHTLAATRIISANVPNSDFIPFTWAFSRIFNATLMIAGVSISLWVTRNSQLVANSVSDLSNQKKGFSNNGKILFSVSLAFVSFAIISVFIAATSDTLPKTTFPNALVTRPYDLLPLALFIFSGTLVWGWFKKKATILKFALLLSLIPEIATQIHMSFGSTSLFDNHFNIAHSLKIVAYAILTIGLIASLLNKDQSKEDANQIDQLVANQFDNSQFDRRVPHSSQQDLLEIGSAKYPQVFLISAFTFILSLAITLIISSVNFVEAEKTAREKQLVSVTQTANFIEPLIAEVYGRAEDDIHFLAKTPPIQGLINAIKIGDKIDYKLWEKRLQQIFEQFLLNDLDYEQVRFIRLGDSDSDSDSYELLRSYRINVNAYSQFGNTLTPIDFNELVSHRSSRAGQVTFFSSRETDKEHDKGESFVHLTLPIFDESDHSLFGVMSIQINFTHFLNRVHIFEKIDNDVFIAQKSGEILYSSSENLSFNEIANSEIGLKELFPILSDTVDKNTEQLDVGFTSGEENSSGLYGYYKTIYLQPSDPNNSVKLFINIDSNKLTQDLSEFRNKSLLMGFAFSLLSLTLAILVSRRLSAPLQQTTQALVRYGYTGKIDDLPTKANDETGVLARSFHNLLVSKAAQDKEILQQKKAMDEHAIVSVTDVDGIITYVNDKFMSITGYSRKELLGQRHDLVDSGFHEKEFFQKMHQQIQKGKSWNHEVCNKAKDGHMFWVDTTVVPFMNNDGVPESYIYIQTDVSEAKMNAIEVSETRDVFAVQVEQLKEANADLDQFAYVASHDLKSPLNGINQLVSWIDDDCRELLPDDSKEHLELLKSRSKRMMNLLNDLLDYSRIGRDEYGLETINLAEVSNELFDLQGNKDGFTCTADDVDIEIQRIPFEMVLRNLISNAIKHHDKGKGKIKVAYHLLEEFGTKQHEFRVSDDGPGIPKELQAKAMEMFQTLQSRDKVEGSGMGLAMVRKMAERNGGSLSIESFGGQGTTFIVKWNT